jgi:hypothetical protein
MENSNIFEEQTVTNGILRCVSTTSLPTVRNKTVTIRWTWLSRYAVTYCNLHSAVTVCTTLAKLRSHIHRLYSAVPYNKIENLVIYNSQNPRIPCTPWDTEHRHPHQRKVTPTTHKYMATIHPAYTPYHYTQASYPHIFSYPTEWTRSSTPRTHTTANRSCPSRSSKKQPTSPHRQFTILLLNCKKTN